MDLDIESRYDSLSVTNNHGASGVNVPFCDRHVEWVKRAVDRNSFDKSEDLCRTRWYHGQ